jgi:hypothetical protein
MKEAVKSDLELILKSSSANIPEIHKIKTYALLSELQEKSPVCFGIIAALGYEPGRDSEYVSAMCRDYFKKIPVNIHDGSALKRLLETVCSDGAVLIDSAGEIIHSGMYLAYKSHKEVLKGVNAKRNGSLPERFGFCEDVGTRHISAVCASYRMPDTMVYIISEETGRMRVFEKGRIIYSPMEKEMQGNYGRLDFPAAQRGFSR